MKKLAAIGLLAPSLLSVVLLPNLALVLVLLVTGAAGAASILILLVILLLGGLSATLL